MSILSEMSNMVPDSEITLIGDAAIESEIVLDTIRANCASDEEFNDVIQDAAVEMSLYGLIDDAEVAMEATKKIIINDYKNVQINRLAGRCAIRLAKKANSSEYKKYVKYRALYVEAKRAIFKKYGAKAKIEAKKILQNSKRKAANLETKGGKSIAEKIDREIARQEKNK